MRALTAAGFVAAIVVVITAICLAVRALVQVVLWVVVLVARLLTTAGTAEIVVVVEVNSLAVVAVCVMNLQNKTRIIICLGTETRITTSISSEFEEIRPLS